ncbi:MAG: hypothetical protein ACHQ49_13005 [Elusimicrobiota bacterium]
MPRKSPEAPRDHALILFAAADAAARWFRAPDPAALSAARTARLRSRGLREIAVSALKSRRGPAVDDAADYSFALREAVEHAVAAVSDAALWGIGADAEFAEMAEDLRSGAKSLSLAAARAGEARAAALDDAKRRAASVERRRRAVRAAARESPFFADAVKRGEVASRLSAAAESLQQACDALAGSLAE